MEPGLSSSLGLSPQERGCPASLLLYFTLCRRELSISAIELLLEPVYNKTNYALEEAQTYDL